MSKQQSMTPDAPEVPRHSGGSRKAKPWVVWHRFSEENRWFSRFRQWSRMGRYATQEVARSALESDAAKGWPRPKYEYRLMHEREGKPE
jgi:hypothetical protein